MPPVVAAFVYPLIVHLVGFIIGVRRVVWHALAKRSGVPAEAVDAGAHAANLILRLLTAATVVFLVALAFGYGRVSELVSQFPQLGVGGALALVVLSLLYLPNAAVAQLAVLLGGSFEAAGAGVSLFATSNVAYPPLPLFAAIPAEMPQWAPVLLIVPAAVLALGPDHPNARRWLRAHWGTEELRRVERLAAPASRRPKGQAGLRFGFFAADAAPTAAVRRLAKAWPRLQLNLLPAAGDAG